MSGKNSSKIAVIGAGFLGLSLAYYLARDGYSVTVLEKAQETGGLAGGFKVNGASLEKYYHHLFKSDTAMQSLLSDLGILDQLEWIPAKMGIYYQKRLYDFSGAFDLLKFPPLNIFDRARSGIVAMYLQKFATEDSVKGLTALAWCKKNFGPNVSRVIWEPLLRSKFGDKYDKVSMVWLWSRLKDRGSSRPGLLKDERLGYFKGGFQVVLDKLVLELHRLHVEIHTEASILDFQSNGRDHKLTWRDKHAKVHNDHFTHIAATIPPAIFQQLFTPPTPYLKAWQPVQFIGALCLVLVLKKSLQPYYWTSINDPEAPFVAMVEHTNLVGTEPFKGDHILYLGKYLQTDSALYRADDSTILKTATDFLKQVNPEFAPDWIKASYIFKAPQAQHIVTPDYQVPPYASGLKKIYLAHFAQIYPHDRGTNYAVAEALELSKLIKHSN